MDQDTILLVDDDLDQLTMLAGMLMKFPQNVITALSGARAIDILKDSATPVPALIITDMVMPDIGGAELLRFVRNDERLKSTKVVLVSAMMKYITEDDQKLADKVMIKPLKKSDVETTVKELLAMPL